MFLCLVQHIIESCIMFIRNVTVQNGILNSLFQNMDYGRWFNSKSTHYFESVNRWLEITYAVTLFKVNHLTAYQFEVLQMALFLLLVL